MGLKRWKKRNKTRIIFGQSAAFNQRRNMFVLRVGQKDEVAFGTASQTFLWKPKQNINRFER